MVVPLIAIGLVILILVATLSVVAGAISTGAEGWNTVDAFYSDS